MRVPIVVDKNAVIICGHTRLLAAKKLGLSQVPVHVAANLTAAQVKAYRLMGNRSHEETDWDLDLLVPEMQELRALNFDLDYRYLRTWTLPLNRKADLVGSLRTK